ncbi:hypothetical protein INQ27_01285 [Wolbachia endosymbiont of Ceratitis capitata]|uniref:DNA methyltransferase n=1 Tax=Wolbachia endosymbiont of Ceratitis capitata TaxID=323653 RepID=UPI001BD62647|nr:DNA methyltransferase [Wolbachia endosymbiont of Ceratitis capitata]MBS9528889.1 hypothetical protein [Wolbachia endosymbiont of Ceratitis capitata]
MPQLPDTSLDLVITSPPFALQRKKEYGNESQAEYVAWLSRFAKLVHSKLKDTGSFVLDLGGAYEKGVPSRSLYNFRVLAQKLDDATEKGRKEGIKIGEKKVNRCYR